MEKRTEKISMRTTKETNKRLNELLKNGNYKFFSKSDIVNLILEENIEKYGKVPHENNNK